MRGHKIAPSDIQINDTNYNYLLGIIYGLCFCMIYCILIIIILILCLIKEKDDIDIEDTSNSGLYYLV